MDWVIEELSELDLGDKRLNTRAKKVLSDFAKAPERSIPVASTGWAETKAAYRLMSNERVSFEKILAVHRNATLKRIEGSEDSTIIIAQDTSELAYEDQREKAGRGPTNTEYRPGVY